MHALGNGVRHRDAITVRMLGPDREVVLMPIEELANRQPDAIMLPVSDHRTHALGRVSSMYLIVGHIPFAKSIKPAELQGDHVGICNNPGR